MGVGGGNLGFPSKIIFNQLLFCNINYFGKGWGLKGETLVSPYFAILIILVKDGG